MQGPDFLYFVNLGHKTTLRELAIQSLVYRSRILESVEFFSQFETGASPCNLILNQDLNKWFEKIFQRRLYLPVSLHKGSFSCPTSLSTFLATSSLVNPVSKTSSGDDAQLSMLLL